MKKYISFLFVLLMVVGLSITIANAEDNGDNTDATSTEDKNRPSDVEKSVLNKLENRLPKEEREAVKTEREKLKNDLRLKDEKAKLEIKDTREALKKETEQKREEVKQVMEQKIEKVKQERETIQEERKTKMEALKEEIKGEKDAEKAKIKEERITGREKALERFGKIEENLNNLKDKINIKIADVEAKGVDTIGAKNLIATAEAKLTEMQTKITKANALLVTSTNEISAETRTALRLLTQDIQSLVKDIHQTLGDAVKSLKEAVNAKIEADKAALPPTTPSETTN